MFEGPFDLLLGLISKHKLDITEVALSQVTDEFIAYIRACADGWDLDQASYFLVVAATLLDLKAARLLPSGRGRGRGGPGPAGGQGPAVRPAAAVPRLQGGRGRVRGPDGGPGPPVRPPGADGTAVRRAAARGAARPRPGRVRRDRRPRAGPPPGARGIHRAPARAADHACASRRLSWPAGCAGCGRATFRRLAADCAGTYEVVARFLALLELYREGSVSFDQVTPLGELYVTWVADQGSE